MFSGAGAGKTLITNMKGKTHPTKIRGMEYFENIDPKLRVILFVRSCVPTIE